MRLAAGTAFLMLVLNLWVQPAAYREMRRELFEVKADLAATLVREGEFTQPAPGLTVYAQSVDSAGNLENLFIHQVKSDGSDTTYSAEKGRIAHAQGGRPVLILTNGSNQQLSRRGVLNYLTFRSYTYDLSSLMNSAELIHYKPSDRFMHELFFPDLQQDWERRNRLSLLSEGHARLATPLYNIAFMALALWAILGGGFSRLGYGRRIAAMGATAAFVRIVGFQVEAAAEDSAWMNLLQYGVPLITTWIAMAGIFRRQRAPRRLAAVDPRLSARGAAA
jgi:lipopolysaccharide export system permease protein